MRANGCGRAAETLPWGVRLLLLASVIGLCPALLPGQGFGTLKKTITLERKLPAAVKLPGNAFNVKATANKPEDPCQKLAAEKLQSMVETSLIRFNSQLDLNPDKPDTADRSQGAGLQRRGYEEHDTLLAGKNKGQSQKPTGVKVNGHLQVTYQARTRAGKFVDAEPIDIKYDHEFNQVTGAISETKKILGKIPRPGARHKDAEGEDEPHTMEDVVEILVDRAAQRVAARLVNTNERVEVALARGSLESHNRYAEAGQLTKFVEELETMAPLPRLDDDAYRLYNIGVGDEALGYKADSPASAKRYFEQAVMQYRKAGEANPQEKYFIEPVNRIEVALEHYKQLSAAAGRASRRRRRRKRGRTIETAGRGVGAAVGAGGRRTRAAGLRRFQRPGGAGARTRLRLARPGRSRQRPAAAQAGGRGLRRERRRLVLPVVV